MFATLGAYSLNNYGGGPRHPVGHRRGGLLHAALRLPGGAGVIGLILGPLAEQQFRRALAISQGDYTIFVTRPISAALLAVAAVALLGPLVARLIIRRRAAGAGAAVSAGQ